MPTLAWGRSQLCYGERTPPMDMDRAMAVFHGWIRPRGFQAYRETPSLTLPCRHCLETQRDYEQEALVTKLWKSEVRTCWWEADASFHGATC